VSRTISKGSTQVFRLQDLKTLPYMDGLITRVVDAIDKANLTKTTGYKTETMGMGSKNF